MFSQTNKRRDAFAFSLGGMTAVSGFASIPAVADDHFSKKSDNEKSASQPRQSESWSQRRGHKAA